MDADANNPNLYCSIDEMKDNRRRQENMYDEIQKRATMSSSAAAQRTDGTYAKYRVTLVF